MRNSNLKYKLFILLFLALTQNTWAKESNWPHLDKMSDSAICTEALKIAKSAYRSDNFYLYELTVLPNDINSSYVLQPSGFDISGGDALIEDASIFKKIPKNNNDGNDPRSIYWQIKANHGLRYVINEDAFGWRGDQYTLFAIKEDITPEQFITGYNRNTQEAAFSPIIGEGWRPPLMMQERKAGNIWAIDVGAPYIFLSEWNIYSMDSDGAKQRCTIHFHPKIKTDTSLLPSPVRKLATLLDGTLGNGQNEGTLQPTAHIRIEVMHMWANVAMRPWAALKAKPYNSSEQVNAELKIWSKKAKSFRTVYQNILTQYPKAEKALARYYKTKFAKTNTEAKLMAKQAVDLAFRTYFVFSR